MGDQEDDLRRAPITARPVLLAVLWVVAGSSRLALTAAPLLAGVLLSGGAALAAWTGWQVGSAARPPVATLPVRVDPGRRTSLSASHRA
jgi:hypothetical protein